jgi:hypothetical protein
LPNTHSVVDTRWRYNVYADGSEELYDRRKDRHEFTNLASDARYSAVKRRLARHVPPSSAPPAPLNSEYDFDFATHTYRRKAKP